VHPVYLVSHFLGCISWDRSMAGQILGLATKAAKITYKLHMKKTHTWSGSHLTGMPSSFDARLQGLGLLLTDQPKHAHPAQPTQQHATEQGAAGRSQRQQCLSRGTSTKWRTRRQETWVSAPAGKQCVHPGVSVTVAAWPLA